MKIPFFLVVNSGGSVRTMKSKPDLRWDEISVFVRLELPDALFKKPQLSAQITIPEEAAVQNEISASVIEDARAAIEQSTGLDVRISIVSPEDKD